MSPLIQERLTNPLKRWRREHHYSQVDVADLSGLSEQTVRRVEHGTLAMPREIAHLIGGSANYEYEQWRARSREHVKQNMADEIREALHWLQSNQESLHTEFNAFKAFRTALDLSSVNSMAALVKVDPRRITEVEAAPYSKNARPLGIEYRRALIQIGVPAETLADWERVAQDD